VATVRYLVTDVERSIGSIRRRSGSAGPEHGSSLCSHLLQRPDSLACRPAEFSCPPMPDGRLQNLADESLCRRGGGSCVTRGGNERPAYVSATMLCRACGKQILLEDPDGNLVELFEAAR